MKFCPNCETRLKNKMEEKIQFCPKCGFSSSNKDEEKNNGKAKQTMEESDDQSTNLKVMDEVPETLPTTTIECPKCKNSTAYWWMLQTRSADEATTQFYRCTECKHTWRNYS